MQRRPLQRVGLTEQLRITMQPLWVMLVKWIGVATGCRLRSLNGTNYVMLQPERAVVSSVMGW